MVIALYHKLALFCGTNTERTATDQGEKYYEVIQTWRGLRPFSFD